MKALRQSYTLKQLFNEFGAGVCITAKSKRFEEKILFRRMPLQFQVIKQDEP